MSVPPRSASLSPSVMTRPEAASPIPPPPTMTLPETDPVLGVTKLCQNAKDAIAWADVSWASPS